MQVLFCLFRPSKMSAKKKSIIFDDSADIDLLKEVSAADINPFEEQKEWENIAEHFTKAKKLAIPATARTVRDRTKKLLEKWAASEKKSRLA